ncbi:DUF2608 domain-containing protein [Alteromonas sp. RKMC-009]|uniref:DUF2608 domain-containing protein n=1 Tax=Alteromonas sp. RKMC-009 TaxID=2267264 RepID=UPI000E68BCBB|nr:DUF2608 domain-containing protein [Alteromonas sp. RKMC-009]AYA66088.1 DUF2608 domain-containing protein [Alteromonas sp. RKMC-009]
MLKQRIYSSLIPLIVAATLSACSATPPPPVTGSATITETAHFAEVNLAVETLNARYGAANVLIVSDIDNTLLTSASDLGGDIWYQWQRGKLDVKPTLAQKVSCLFEDTIGMLYELNPMTVTDPLVPEIVASWQLAGNTVMALTSRDPRYRSATERELKSNGIELGQSALTLENGVMPEYRHQMDRELTYSQGVMMTTGMDKGKMLHWILDKTGRHFDAVIFIDDSRKNIDNMYTAWKDGNTDMDIFYYTSVEDARIARHGTVLTQAQADKMAADYDKLNKTLLDVFPGRSDGLCLTVN